jgi:hypothetical protein
MSDVCDSYRPGLHACTSCGFHEAEHLRKEIERLLKKYEPSTWHAKYAATEARKEGRYGIWITYEWWATVDGGPDDVGTREEMEKKAAEYTAEILPGHISKYEVRPYTGNDPAEDTPEDIEHLRQRLEAEDPLPRGEVKAALREAREILVKHEARAFVPWPKDKPHQHNANREACDMWTGPCCCGAWHRDGV